MSNKHLENVKVVINFKKQIFFAPFYIFTSPIQQKSEQPMWIARSMEVN